jgi:spermidine dehydrogenase
MDARDRELGMGAPITRKDFLNTTLLGVGSTLLGVGAPSAWLSRMDAARRRHERQDEWTGFGGVGDYAQSNGNTLPVLESAHRIRDGAYTTIPPDAVDTGETYDLVIVGGGLSGLTAAWSFARETGGSKRCLVLENHPIFGGEAKQNEFDVNGVRLVAPQGSNQFGAPRAGSGNLTDQVWTDLALPRQFRYEEPDASVADVRIPLDNYAHMDGVNETQVDVGYWFDGPSGGRWMRNIWANDLEGTPFSAEVKADLLRWRTTSGESGEEARRALDTMTYAQVLEQKLGLRPEVTAYIAPVIGLINGASPDAVSAFASSQIGMPGVARVRSRTGPLPQSFPGGNSTLSRHFVKYLVPDAISGEKNFDGVFDGRVDFGALDRSDRQTRIRLGSIVVRVEHGSGAGDGSVVVAYENGGRVYRVRARSVIMASGGWINKHILADMPSPMHAAYDEFRYAPAMVVNVALTNWRFLARLGISSARWFDDTFGFSCNIRRPMIAGAQRHAVHPDRPTVLTFYMGLYTPGKTVMEQGTLGRTALLSTSYADFERRIRGHMLRLFGDQGFDPAKDIAGIILNRWGHARLVQEPGFYFGRNGRASVREIVEQGYGRIVIGHSELNGHQSMSGAMAQGSRAAADVLKLG